MLPWVLKQLHATYYYNYIKKLIKCHKSEVENETSPRHSLCMLGRIRFKCIPLKSSSAFLVDRKVLAYNQKPICLKGVVSQG